VGCARNGGAGAGEHGLSKKGVRAHPPSDLGPGTNLTELGIFAPLWSEHCSYKSSRIHLKKFPMRRPSGGFRGPARMRGARGPRAGWVTVFKNGVPQPPFPSSAIPGRRRRAWRHPARRSFTMGARPVNAPRLNCGFWGARRFSDDRTWSTASVRGIGDYGNCVRRPHSGTARWTSTRAYNGNILVNAIGASAWLGPTGSSTAGPRGPG